MLIILILEIMIVEGYDYCISFTEVIIIIHHDTNDNSGKTVGKVEHRQLFCSVFRAVSSSRFTLISETLLSDRIKGSVYLMTASLKEIF